MKPHDASCRGSSLHPRCVCHFSNAFSAPADYHGPFTGKAACPPRLVTIRVKGKREVRKKAAAERVDRCAARFGNHRPTAIKKRRARNKLRAVAFSSTPTLPVSIQPVSLDSGKDQSHIDKIRFDGGPDRNHGTGRRSSVSATSREKRSITRPWAAARSSKPVPARGSDRIVR